ncbi:MAG: hypothetical protein J0H42_01410 [Rhizobiales bacterium]|nr:hypothetical protein [Hyphomicrobiales bacterium]
MTKTIPALAAAFLMTAVATPVFAQAAIQEPGAYAFYHPNADVLNPGRGAVRPYDANAYYGEGVVARETQPGSRPVAARRHRR